MMFLALLLTLCVSLAFGRPEYQARIPNGANVRATNGQSWPGVGHLRAGGSGPLNPFGLDFQAAGYKWTQELCRKDSDGDGASNGQELGDPDCIWNSGDTPASSEVSHPGFPGDAKDGSFDTCKDFEAPPNSRIMTVQFSTPFALPGNRVTTYPRQAFDLREVPGSAGDEDHWAFRFEVEFGGREDVVHHILLYACTETQVTSPVNYITQPTLSEGMPCTTQGLIFGWAIGGAVRWSNTQPFCMPPNVAIKIKKSAPFVLMEVHMNNAQIESGIESRPGFKITVLPLNEPQPATPIQEANWLWVGATLPSIQIPPGEPYVELTTEFTVPDISGFSIQAQVFASLSHMHYIGRKIWVEIIRPDQVAETAACDPLYNNENQEVIPLKSTLTVGTGDKIVTHCVYNSTGKTEITFGGEETDDEMCFVFMLFTSDLIKQTVPVHLTANISTSPQRTSVTCEAAAQADGSLAYFPVPTKIIVHAIFGALGLGFLLPIGTLFPASHHMRRLEGNIWFKAHMGTMLTATLMGLAAFILGALSVNAFPSSSHGKLGLVLIILLFLQVLMGAFRPHLPAEGEAKSVQRKGFEAGHPVLGLVIVGCIGLQIFWGYELLYVYWPAPELEAWKWVHVTGLLPLWFISMILLHVVGSAAAQQPSSEKQAKLVAVENA